MMDKVLLENIKEGMTQLIQKAKIVTSSVKVSSVLPWTKRADCEHVAEVNNTLRETCDEMNVTFVNQHVNFTFRNGEFDTALSRKTDCTCQTAEWIDYCLTCHSLRRRVTSTHNNIVRRIHSGQRTMTTQTTRERTMPGELSNAVDIPNNDAR